MIGMGRDMTRTPEMAQPAPEVNILNLQVVNIINRINVFQTIAKFKCFVTHEIDQAKTEPLNSKSQYSFKKL